MNWACWPNTAGWDPKMEAWENLTKKGTVGACFKLSKYAQTKSLALPIRVENAIYTKEYNKKY